MKYLILSTLSFVLMSCASGRTNSEVSLGDPVYYGKAVIYGLKSQRSMGTLNFSEAFGKVKVEGDVSNLLPGKEHGISIYQYGDCDKPGERYEGGAKKNLRAIGRLGNILAGKDGRSQVSLEIEGLSINTGDSPIIGRSVVIHQHKDDMVSKGHGGAGQKIACGVIGASSK